MISFVCARDRFVQNHCKVLAITLSRLLCLFITGFCLYTVPEWFEIKANVFESALCWALFAFHITATSSTITLVFAVFVSEELYLNYNWRACKEFFCGKTIRIAPPEYIDTLAHLSLPPSYEDAVASPPPEYTPTDSTSSQPLQDTESYVVTINRAGVQFSRVSVERNEEHESAS
ncbi:unnamed protein product [Caenorhabditis sp. 36 PRJEB53466]|nr:unnamed protein product [Caenorhabditis sp. 36 PRJEB53466]